MEAEDVVEVLQDPSMYTRSIHKENGARWVRGLTPVDAEVERQEQRDYRSAIRRRFSMFKFNSLMEHWLRLPILLGVLSFISTAFYIATWTEVFAINFPPNEEELWVSAARPQEKLEMFLYKLWYMWGVSFLQALFSLTLSWSIGTAARHFSALCGVGISLLSLMAIMGQLLMLWLACGISPLSKRNECNIPFTLYWTFSVGRTVGPLLALWCIAPVLDIMQGNRFYWKILLGVPVFVYIVGVTLLVVDESSSERGYLVYWCCCCAALVSWVPLIVSCIKQRWFQVVFTPKRHKE
ncbi:uncharacterized protein TM35_000163000 [Trypanosoma theileri]|uniref:Uncharacterized protein n=1 Tax=Trypanosoma theileri TaxID=67003 RepID=A0A1X0NVF3_9TRYP|nr:uncharacterized protein TM35_000163000 [Trypanosoma theileri]ORC88662.1 hypothetical protein TM35_000163000 [Trypanosoma theileri]